MDLRINEETKKASTECRKNFSCLSGNQLTLCKVEQCVTDNLHFIKCINSELCSYQMSFGSSHVCTCPVRKELYNRYKI